MNPNIPLGLATYFLSALRGSLWLVGDAYVLLLPEFGSNTNVGIMEGAAGIVNIFAAGFGGVVVDKVSRSSVLRISAALSVVVTGVMAFAVLYLPHHATTKSVYIALVAASVLSGINRGLFLVAFEALFGDSTPSGSARVRYYVWKQAAATTGLAIGPFIAVACFLLTHDSWTQPELIVVILVCAAVGLIQGFMQLFFRDMPYEPGLDQTSPEQPQPQPRSSEAISAPLLHQSQPSAPDTSSPTMVINTISGTLTPSVRRRPSAAYVAPLIGLSNLALGLGSGVAYKFIPLFCLSTLGLSPIATHAMIGGMQAVATVLGLAATRFARHVGAIGVTVAYMVISVAGLAAVCASRDLQLGTGTIVAAMVVRGSFANACGGLTGSVLNDHISAKNRGKWSIVSQLSRCTWSASAFVGGVLVDATHSYERTFLMPLGCHIVAICLLLPLLVIVKPGAPPTKQHLRDSADRCNAPEAAGSMSDSSVTPLPHIPPVPSLRSSVAA